MNQLNIKILLRYHNIIVGNFGGSNFGDLQFFSGWWVLVWWIGGHVIEHVNSNEIGGFTFGKIIIKKSPNLPKLNSPKLPVIQCFQNN